MNNCRNNEKIEFFYILLPISFILHKGVGTEGTLGIRLHLYTPVSGEYYNISRQDLGKTTPNPPK